MKPKAHSGSSGKSISVKKEKKNSMSKPKTKFEEFLAMDINKGLAGAEEDFEMERRLAKKLRVKEGRLKGSNDLMDELIEGIPSVLDDEIVMGGDMNDYEKVVKSTPSSKKHKNKKKLSQPSAKLEDEVVGVEEDADVVKQTSSSKKRKRKKSSQLSTKKDMINNSIQQLGKNPEDQSVEDLPKAEEDISYLGNKETDIVNEEESHVGAHKVDSSMKYVAPHLRACTNKESEEISQIRRRIRGFLNRLCEANVESITEEVAAIFRSLSRSVGCQIIGEEVVASCSRGPRGNEQYAAVFAAFVAGMACLVGIDFSAKLISSIAKSFEDEYSKDDGLSLRNLTLLISYLCIFGVCSSDLIYDLLSVLSKRLTEMDVSTILTILQCCGMKLRSDDPIGMKDFVLSIQNKVNEARLFSKTEKDGKPMMNNKRMEFMLETILDIKNNKKRPKDDPAHHTRIKKWLQKLRAEDILLRGLKWGKLLDPEKKGQWWLSGDFASTEDNVEEVATTISKDVLETQKLLHLASAQRMNTDVRRAIFCVIMSGEDYIDAFEKILKLGLTGKQDREIMRVLVGCCLQEKVFNKYYTVLASKLCSHDKNHKFTLQYCIWDHYKELDEMELNRSLNLAKFVAEMLSSFSLSLAILKTVNLMEPAQLTPRRIMHFRMLIEAIFENSDALVWNIFTRVAVAPELEILRDGLLFFIKQYVEDANKEKKNAAGKFKIVKKALQNVAGVLL
ncbi:nucleolar MIF4G domain-containing protein 1 [Asparagus officinalis]|nr:nucleolar MIF4G domain-containing protein 1 [Asparagus officinalis]XP_020265488.1 nucleolar MIF4G domain-containing protein 1 [Asparagus officinalis]XP_020265489.1 nucleolar MIF4G domain-containing protein 1 [Asparagus officinalis]XP_020265490.1 nucleolar MIF4G domain-containing protein 1 [Asparagus officinalis]XP_020265491.1 nucleolar MIF4G domain-containing protein 1 [Asparagus officinalis]